MSPRVHVKPASSNVWPFVAAVLLALAALVAFATWVHAVPATPPATL